MPIVKIDGKAVLRCVNHETVSMEEHARAANICNTSMRREMVQAGSLVIAGDAIVVPMRAQVLLRFTCAVCGYVEFYEEKEEKT